MQVALHNLPQQVSSSPRVITKYLEAISHRELQVLRLIAYEYTTKEIADELYVSTHTVDTHRKRLMMKWGVRNTAGLVRVGFQIGILK